jgi:hypothetical protein
LAQEDRPAAGGEGVVRQHRPSQMADW